MVRHMINKCNVKNFQGTQCNNLHVSNFFCVKARRTSYESPTIPILPVDASSVFPVIYLPFSIVVIVRLTFPCKQNPFSIPLICNFVRRHSFILTKFFRIWINTKQSWFLKFIELPITWNSFRYFCPLAPIPLCYEFYWPLHLIRPGFYWKVQYYFSSFMTKLHTYLLWLVATDSRNT